MMEKLEKYKFGFLFFDPEDSRVIVPKLAKYFGWTFNFANLWTYIIISGFILLIVIVSIL
jgi:uncharacterized membrane protein